MRLVGLFLVFVSLFLVSCSTVIKEPKVRILKENYCSPTIAYTDYEVEVIDIKRDSVLANQLSSHDYILATHIGIKSLLSKLGESKDPFEKLELKQQINTRILLFQTEIDAVAAELDCNGERFDQLARVLDSKNNKTNTELTVATIALGAAITLSTALIKNDDLNKGINITGGIAGAGLGFLLLNPKGKKVELNNNRNLLRNVWENNNEDIAFPPALWRVMNEKSFSNEGELSLLQTLKNRWITFAFEDNISKKQEELYFGKGGLFSSDNIHLMSDMNNELQATVRTVQQDLRSLVFNISLLK
ncbi:hypothetical protein SAMN04488018_10731 [Myroides marinus]|uniref:Lipoprotein n=1 Tax=Myroides marinus TaxID=703342 RepID=A0A1H6UWF4_9FLAO|nr:hypothetical protein [Myroides marinus]SEI92660.1 hypothetical protein SAMN04488018_10731 [Myroides marinus]